MERPRLIIAGAGGPIARHITAVARPEWDVTVLTRRVDGTEPEGARAVSWNPTAARDGDVAALDALAAVLEGAKALVNLAGASLAGGRLGADHRRRVLESRVDSTTTLVQAAGRASAPPEVWIQGSASGYYGDRGDAVLTERSEPGSRLFLCEVTAAWEGAAQPAAQWSRLVVTRFGVVLARDAAAFKQLVLPVRLFVGGPLGDGRQWYPWIEADELARVILFLIETDEARGAFNVVAPEPVRQVELTRAIASRLGRPAFVPVPAFALRIVLGGPADEVVLPSQRVVPERLLSLGYEFDHRDVDSAIAKLLG